MPLPNRTLVALLSIALLFAAGCRKRAVHASPPATGEPQPSPKPAESKTETPPETAPTPTLVVPPPKAPAPKHPAAKASTAPETSPAKPAPPQISPRLSDAEQAEYRRKTEDAIAAAEKNLQITYGKQLNTAQNDLAEKIRGFLAQAREAARAGDWVRAENLAQKARLLSVELLNSL